MLAQGVPKKSNRVQLKKKDIKKSKVKYLTRIQTIYRTLPPPI